MRGGVAGTEGVSARGHGGVLVNHGVGRLHRQLKGRSAKRPPLYEDRHCELRAERHNADSRGRSDPYIGLPPAQEGSILGQPLQVQASRAA
jgi:hypothetical protein